MKRLFWLFLALLVSTSLVAETTQRYLVATKRPIGAANLRLLRDLGEVRAHDVRPYRHIGIFGATLTESEALALRRSPDVQSVSPVVEVHALAEGLPLEPTVGRRQSVPYGIDTVRARDVWPVSRGAAKTVNVVVIDTGVDYKHPDLQSRYLGGYNVITQTADPMDDHGHGTHVAGTIAAVDNEFGVVGVAPEVRLWAVKVLRQNGSGTDEQVVAGMDWVIQKKRELGGNWIANLSLGATQDTETHKLGFQRALAEGILIVAAAGNNGAEFIMVPAAYQGVLAVSAIDEDSKLASFSNFGTGIGFAAPGVGVLSTVPVGSVDTADILRGSDELLEAHPLTGSARGEIAGTAMYCGEGHPQDFQASVAGKIAIIRRSPQGSNFYFRDKVNNAKAAGAIAAIIAPIPNDMRNDRAGWTLHAEPGDEKLSFPVVVSVSVSDAEKLIANAGKETLSLSNRSDDYGLLNGTSMATPHVSGVAALVWALAPDATINQLKLAMKLTALDLGAKGYDKQYGYGVIDALAAAKYLAPAAFGVDPPPPLNPTRRRLGHKRP